MEKIIIKNIFFYSNVNISDQNSGISKKVMSQIRQFSRFGYNVYYSSYTEKGVAILNNDRVVFEKNYDTTKASFRYLRRWYLLNLSIDFIEVSNVVFEFSYLRFHFFDATYLKLLKVLKYNGSKNIVEAHSFPYRELNISSYTPTYILDYLYEPLSRKYIDLVAAITNLDKIWGVKTVHIDNAVDLDQVPAQVKVNASSNEIRLMNVSNERHYHGLNKILYGLKNYYEDGGKVDFKINFVGKNLKDTIDLVEELNLQQHVNFFGQQSGNELYNIYNRSDLGIGALGNRANAEFGSTIKTKEYFAIGIPFINGWKEYSFDDSYPYVHRMDLKDKNVDFFEVEKFYNSIREDKNITKKMREYAKNNFSWEYQIEKIVKAITNIEK